MKSDFNRFHFNRFHESLAIHEGGKASASWPKLTDPNTPENEKSKLAQDMLEYCKRETEAMVCILERVEKDIKRTKWSMIK